MFTHYYSTLIPQQHLHRFLQLLVSTIGHLTRFVRYSDVWLHLVVFQKGLTKRPPATHWNPEEKTRVNLGLPPNEGSCARYGHSNQLANAQGAVCVWEHMRI